MRAEDEIDMLLERATRGEFSIEDAEKLKLYAFDERYMGYAMARMQALGIDQVGSPMLAPIETYYVDKPGEKYELRWAIQTRQPLPVDFAELDRRTQFFVLFTEWTRREMEGMELLNAGNSSGAQRVFEECLARATQLEVAELKARSYEGSMKVAEKTGDRHAAREALQKAREARAAG